MGPGHPEGRQGVPAGDGEGVQAVHRILHKPWAGGGVHMAFGGGRWAAALLRAGWARPCRPQGCGVVGRDGVPGGLPHALQALQLVRGAPQGLHREGLPPYMHLLLAQGVRSELFFFVFEEALQVRDTRFSQHCWFGHLECMIKTWYPVPAFPVPEDFWATKAHT